MHTYLFGCVVDFISREKDDWWILANKNASMTHQISYFGAFQRKSEIREGKKSKPTIIIHVINVEYSIPYLTNWSESIFHATETLIIGLMQILGLDNYSQLQ